MLDFRELRTGALRIDRYCVTVIAAADERDDRYANQS
jgi:hypothetical protein